MTATPAQRLPLPWRFHRWLALLLAPPQLQGAAAATRAEAQHEVIVTGANKYEPCLDYATCRSSGFSCFKRAGLEYAMCMPRVGTPCIEAGHWNPIDHSVRDWLCPGWEYCAATHGNCAYTRCCKNAIDVCLSRHTHYASCLPAYTDERMGEVAAATDPVAAADDNACGDLRASGWECRKLLAPPTTCSKDCEQRAASRCAPRTSRARQPYVWACVAHARGRAPTRLNSSHARGSPCPSPCVWACCICVGVRVPSSCVCAHACGLSPHRICVRLCMIVACVQGRTARRRAAANRAPLRATARTPCLHAAYARECAPIQRSSSITTQQVG